MQTTTKPKKRYADIFFQLTRRHLAVFFSNKIRLMYTLLVPVIIFVVYVIFLRDMELSTVRSTVADMFEAGTLSMPLHKDATFMKHCEALVDSWMISGIIGLSTITVALQTNTVIVEDKQNGVNRDFASSPIPKNLLVASYFFYNFIVTALICFAFFLVCLVYFAIMGEFVISFLDVLTVFAVMLYSTVASTLMTVFICSFVNTEATMMSIVAVFSTAVGFLIGAYMPLGMLPVWVQGVCGLIPGTYSCALLRYGFMAAPIERLTSYVNGLNLENGGELLHSLTENFGFRLNFFGVEVSPQFQALALLLFIVIFAALNVGMGKRLAAVLGMGKKKKKQ